MRRLRKSGISGEDRESEIGGKERRRRTWRRKSRIENGEMEEEIEKKMG